MNRAAAKLVISAVLALTMGAGQFAFAKDNNHRNERDGNRSDRDEGRKHERRGNKHDKHDHHDNRHFGRSHNEERKKGRGAGPGHEYYRGDRLPAEYRHRHYVVNDWRGHRLSAPPRGHHWVQSGGDYILIAIATGVIAQLLLSQ